MKTRPKLDRMFKAFADETRLRILHLLTRGELCVCDLTDTLGLRQPKVSRHLAYLRGAGLVEVRKEGLWKHYSLAETRGRFHAGLLACLRGCFAEVDALRRDDARLKKLLKKRSC
ncbi:MAG: metalloregulator ArsR/SmtB family transcription factor [Elusimicrobiota bacterium]|mgnify:CR=1 FL=1